MASNSNDNTKDQHHLLIVALGRVDPLLVFLTRATGQLSVPLPTLFRAMPPGLVQHAEQLLEDIRTLIDMGILHWHSRINAGDVRWDNSECRLGFPPPPLSSETPSSSSAAGNDAPPPPSRTASLHGSTKTAANRRMAALKRLLKQQPVKPKHGNDDKSRDGGATQRSQEVIANNGQNGSNSTNVEEPNNAGSKAWDALVQKDGESTTAAVVTADDPVAAPRIEEQPAVQALSNLMGFHDNNDQKLEKSTINDVFTIPSKLVPRQVSYAGSTPAQDSVYRDLPHHIKEQIPNSLLNTFGLLSQSLPQQQRRLYKHQAIAITSAMEGRHCFVCTGTGSGKSLSFLLPVLTTAYNSNRVSLLLFPTKALAQDQLSKLMELIRHDSDLQSRIRPATLDGDVPHSQRLAIANNCNVILTNPDTLHAALLPAWKSMYQSLLSRVHYVVIDEGHIYEGVFGAHVAMVLSRLVRVRAVAAATAVERMDDTQQGPVIFLGASATLPWPEQHFRLLCPIPTTAPMVILTHSDDGSPRAAKHFFVWNPPILHADGSSTGCVTITRKAKYSKNKSSSPSRCGGTKRPHSETLVSPEVELDREGGLDGIPLAESGTMSPPRNVREPLLYRRHAADETALLLARAVANGVRCIAFCKTRNLVEWVFERAQAALSQSEQPDLASKIESYRGGYSRDERRKIERRLFQNELLGVVGTNALELGVDIGGVDLTLHCGYPSSYASMLQQAGRAGRGQRKLNVPSCAVVVCFNSPSEQHMWRNPQSILGKGVMTKHTIPITPSLVQGHLLCAGMEFPLTGTYPVSAVVSTTSANILLTDQELFGGEEVYVEALTELRTKGNCLKDEPLCLVGPRESMIIAYRTNSSMGKPWSRLSIRAIEPVTYALIDLSHPGQNGRDDGIHDSNAVLDTIPYSRIFYHAHPGAVITHRGRKLKVVSMTRPPPFAPDNFTCRRGLHLASYAKPTNVKYATRPLSNMQITVVKQLERIELRVDTSEQSPQVSTVDSNASSTCVTFAGSGAVSVKRTVHGYKKLSLITRSEIERSELSLPPMEYDTFGLWFDTDASLLGPLLGDKYGPGVHALSHALLAVAPVYAPGLVRSDLECDHSFYAPTRIMIFDERAGGSGACERLWNLFFKPQSLVEAAIQLLEDCATCCSESGYDSGCPACLHASNCLKFNMHLSRSAGAVIGRHLLSRIQCTELFRQSSDEEQKGNKVVLTPRREKRRKAVKSAKEMEGARDRQFVVGRVSWPLDNC